jgi:hypothetical protein
VKHPPAKLLDQSRPRENRSFALPRRIRQPWRRLAQGAGFGDCVGLQEVISALGIDSGRITGHSEITGSEGQRGIGTALDLLNGFVACLK